MLGPPRAAPEGGRARRLATVLWVIWAIVVWNVVFDRVIVMAARRYLLAAGLAARGLGPPALMEAWMRPALARGAILATASASVILVVGFLAGRRARRP